MKESVFSESDESALSIVPSDRSTRFSLDGNRLSIISDDGDIQYIRFSFEDALFTSHVYKRNYRFPTKRTNTNNQPELAAQEESPSPTATKDSETDIDVLTVNEHDEGDEEFFQDEMTQFHHDLFAGEVLEDTVSQPGSSELGDDASRDSDSDTSDTPSIVPWGSGTDEEGVQREQELKKTLSRALQKANTAVLLDNAQNFAGALEAYQEASRLLRRVMIRAKTEEDRRKLDAIVSAQCLTCRLSTLILASEKLTVIVWWSSQRSFLSKARLKHLLILQRRKGFLRYELVQRSN